MRHISRPAQAASEIAPRSFGWFAAPVEDYHHVSMPKFYKRWLWSWVIAGVVAPFALAAVGHFVPPVPETGIFDPPPVLTVAQ